VIRDKRSEEQNFWISYADLMAGILFVFILLIGAIVVKSVLLRQDLQSIRTDLKLESDTLVKTRKNLKLALSQVGELNSTIVLLNDDLAKEHQKSKLSTKEIETLKNLLLEKDQSLDKMLSITQVLNLDLNSTRVALKSSEDNLTITQEQNKHILALKDQELQALQKILLLKNAEYQSVVEDLNLTRIKIKNLTGIKVKVVQHLKQKLGSNMSINPHTGALSLSSNILFEQGSSSLKLESQKALKQTLGRYIDTLLNDKEIAKQIDRVIIEGHTNSDGSYLYNLTLSQERAMSVMKFLYTEYPQNQKLFRQYLSASGRSYAEPIVLDNIEDKNASRRIEVRFLIKNMEATRELMGYINAK